MHIIFHTNHAGIYYVLIIINPQNRNKYEENSISKLQIVI